MVLNTMGALLVTGGAGFIGSNFIRYMLLTQPNVSIINLDKLTYAGNLDSLASIESYPNYVFLQGSIGDQSIVNELLVTYNPSAIVNLAAESHVDRSIDGPAEFVQTNVVETFQLLEVVCAFWTNLKRFERESFRFLHVSTDEVFGSLGQEGVFTEDSPYAPNSPYSASKAASDHLVRAYHHTYGLPVLTTHCSNNYGPYQFPEKLIPLVILNAIEGKSIPVYGDGQNIRDWLYVEDHCRAIQVVLDKGRPGNSYNIGGSSEKTNIQVVYRICDILDYLRPRPDSRSYRTQITFVQDRPGHDMRYAIDAGKIRRELGWSPLETFGTGLLKSVQWYLDNDGWCRRLRDGSYSGQRLGLGFNSRGARND